MQISAANSRATFESRASKFLVPNRTLFYSAQVSGTRKIWCQNAWHMSKVTGTSFWYQKLERRTWVVCHGLTIVTVLATAMFMVLSSWHCHCQSSPGSYDECRTALDSCQSLDEANQVEPQIHLNWQYACSAPKRTLILPSHRS